MRKKLLSLLLIPMAFASANAQTDVTSTYLQNAGFDEESIWVTESKFASTAGEWKIVGSPANGSSGAVGYANNTTMNSVSCSTNPEGGTDGGALNLSIGWAGSVQYTQSVTLPVGFYKLGYKAYNANTSASTVAKNLIGFIPEGGSIAYGSTTDFGKTTWTDELSTIIPGGSGNVSVGFVSNSNVGSGSSAKLFIDYVKLYSLDLMTYSERNPLDVTDIITRPDATKELGSWSITGGNSFHVNTWSSEGSSDGSNMITPFFEDWIANGGLLSDATIVSSFSNIPAGTYRFTALVRTLNEAGNATPAGASMFVNHDGSQDVCGGSTCTNGTYGTFSAIGTVGTDGVLRVGFKIADATINWISFRDLKLEYLGANLETMQAALKTLVEKCDTYSDKKMASTVSTALATAKKAGESESLTTLDAVSKAIGDLNTALNNADESIAAYATLKETIDSYASKVESLDESGKAAYDVTEIVSKYNNGTYQDTEITAATEAVAEAYFVAVKAQTSEGASFTGLIINPSFETGDTQGWTCTANSNDTGARLNSNNTYKATGCDGNYLFNTWNSSAINFFVQQTISNLPAGSYTLSAKVTSDANNTISLSANDNSNDITISGSKAAFEDVSVTFDLTGLSDVTIKASSSSWFKADNFTLTRNGGVTYTREATTSGYGTICLPYAAKGAENVKVYEIAGTDNVEKPTTVYLTEVESMVAGKPYIYYAGADGTAAAAVFTQTNTTTVESPVAGKNNLTGVFTGGTGIIANGSYILKSGKWYYVDNSSEFTCGDNRAYISTFTGMDVVTEASSEVKAMSIIDNDATAINGVENAAKLNNATIYTLSGQRVNNVSKGGIYIVNGKKVFVK